MRALLIAGMSMMLTLSTLRAEAQTDKQGEATAAFKSGVKLFKATKYKEAVQSFRRAYELKPSWKIQYNIGQCEAALKRYGLAIEAFEAYLGEGGDEVPEDRQEAVLQELKRMRLMIGSIKVSGREGIDVYIDEIKRGRTPVNSPIPVTAGVAHTIWFVQDGRKLATLVETIVGGQTTELTVPEPESDAPPAAAVAPPPPPPPESPPAEAAPEKPVEPQPEEPAPATGEEKSPPPPKAPQRTKPLKPTLFFVGAGTAVVFGGAALALALVSDNMWERTEDTVQNDPWEYDDSDRTTIQALHIAGYACLGVAAAGLITAIVAAPFTQWKKEAPAADPKVSLRPWARESSGGLFMEGSF